MALSGITTITFDADDTLWDFEAGMRNALGRLREEIGLLARLGSNVPTIEAMMATRAALGDEPNNEMRTLDALRREAIRLSAGEAGISDPGVIDDLFDKYVDARHYSTPIYPETVPTLQTLGQHFQLGVITNSNTHPSEIGLGQPFTFAVLGDSERFRKPDPRIFRHAADLGGYELERSIHVGDSLVNDVEGANNAGVTSVWLDRRGEAGVAPNPADHTIGSLLELPVLLGIA